MEFINGKKDGNGNVFDVEIGNEERHLTEVNVSGKNEADKVCNIFDLESNCGEFVAEKSNFNNDEPYSNRGGVYDKKTSCASRRFTFKGMPNEAGSFHFVLYVM